MSSSTKGIEEALQSILSRGDGTGVGAKELIGGIVTLISKQLENSEEREDLVEKLEALTGKVATIGRIVARNHKLLQAIHKTLGADLQVLCEQQTASGEAVLSLADQLHRHLGRLELIEEDDEGEELEPVEARGSSSGPARKKRATKKTTRRK